MADFERYMELHEDEIIEELEERWGVDFDIDNPAHQRALEDEGWSAFTTPKDAERGD